MSEKNNGGPAFPQPCAENGWASNNEYGQAGGGLSLRDYFAAKAMQSYIARANYCAGNDMASRRIENEWAQAAYNMADAMLAERNK